MYQPRRVADPIAEADVAVPEISVSGPRRALPTAQARGAEQAANPDCSRAVVGAQASPDRAGSRPSFENSGIDSLSQAELGWGPARCEGASWSGRIETRNDPSAGLLDPALGDSRWLKL